MLAVEWRFLFAASCSSASADPPAAAADDDEPFAFRDSPPVPPAAKGAAVMAPDEPAEEEPPPADLKKFKFLMEFPSFLGPAGGGTPLTAAVLVVVFCLGCCDAACALYG